MFSEEPVIVYSVSAAVYIDRLAGVNLTIIQISYHIYLYVHV
jgi:hypothetical protein